MKTIMGYKGRIEGAYTMKKFEYRLENLEVDVKTAFNPGQEENQEVLTTKLNELGKDGWRLCGVAGQCYYFTRERA